jgi:phage gp36-like protein
MAAYAAIEELTPGRISEQELIELTDDTGSGGVRADIVQAMLDQASATIDSYCSQRYTVPLRPSIQLKETCLDLTVYRLFSRRRRVSEDVRDTYNAAVQFLRDVAAGKAALDQPTDPTTPQVSSGAPNSTKKPLIFNDDNLRGY